MVTRDWGEGKNREFLHNGYRVSVWDDENVLEMVGGDGVQNCEGTECHQIVYFKNGLSCEFHAT